MINTIKVNQCQQRKTSSNDNNLQFIDCPKNLSSDESLVLNIIKGIIKSGGEINVPIRHETISSRSKFGKTKVKEIINKLNSLAYLNRKQGFNLGYKCKKGRDNTWYYSAPEQNVILISTRINTGSVKFRPTRSKNKENLLKIKEVTHNLGITFLPKSNFLYDKFKESGIFHDQQLNTDEKLSFRQLKPEVLEEVGTELCLDLASMRVLSSCCALEWRNKEHLIIDQKQAFLGYCKAQMKSGFMHTWFYQKSVKIWRKIFNDNIGNQFIRDKIYSINNN